MTRFKRRLLQEVDVWVAEGFMAPDHANRIRDHIARDAQRSEWGTRIFGGLGMTIVGLGVILMLAYNWEAIPRIGKLLLLGTALVASRGLALFFFHLRTPRWRWLGETFYGQSAP